MMTVGRGIKKKNPKIFGLDNQVVKHHSYEVRRIRQTTNFVFVMSIVSYLYPRRDMNFRKKMWLGIIDQVYVNFMKNDLAMQNTE